ncbi:MAG: glycosyltransferase family 9 protein [Synergistaceae bacterium]|nr:glycosyltransferase family 9 protein [Synergistaceae bacterium]
MPVKNLWPHPKAGDKVLWIRLSAFGDVLQAAASAHRFRLKYPDVSLTFLTKAGYADILKIQPYVDDLILWDIKKRPFDFFRVLREVRERRFDWLFSMHRVFSSALIALFSGIPHRYGYNRGMQFCYKSTHYEFFSTASVDLDNRDIPSIFTTQEGREEARNLLAPLPQKKLFAVIGASKPQKFWPVRHWIEFLRSILPDGWGVVLNGHGDEEAKTAKSIEDALGSSAVLNLVGRMSFPLNAAVAEASTVAVGNDTGPLHLASLVGTPTLGFFGVTDAYAVNFRMPWFRDIKVSCPLVGCWNYSCPKECLADITPDQAARAFRSFVSEVLPS